MSNPLVSPLCTINVKLIRTSDRAALVTCANRRSKAAWVSLVSCDLSANEDGTYRLAITERSARLKGLL